MNLLTLCFIWQLRFLVHVIIEVSKSTIIGIGIDGDGDGAGALYDANDGDVCGYSLWGADLARTYTQDGVCLTESGLCQLQSLSAAASRRRKPKPKLKLKIINQNSVAVLQTPTDLLSELSRDEDTEDTRGGHNASSRAAWIQGGGKNKNTLMCLFCPTGLSRQGLFSCIPLARICSKTRYCIFLGECSDLMASS